MSACVSAYFRRESEKKIRGERTWGVGREEEKEGRGRNTFLIWAFHFWVPILTFTVFSMRPLDTTTAFMRRSVGSAAATCFVAISRSCQGCGGRLVGWEAFWC